MTVSMIGLDHNLAPARVREKIAFNAQEAGDFLPELTRLSGSAEGVLISTCNRTEFYYLSSQGSVAPDPASLIEAKKGLPPGSARWLRLEGREAIAHLFRVAAGLESMVRGEAQILGQVKDAFRNAVDAMTTGPVLNRVFHAAFRAGKRARAETGISEGAVSVSLAAVELALSQSPVPLGSASIVLIGAGQMAGLIARHLKSKGAKRVLIANRTLANAECLASETGFAGAGLESLGDALQDADVLFSAVAGDGLAVAADRLEGRAKPILCVDIGMPRTIDPAAASVPGVALRNVDDLRSVVDCNVKRREEEAAKASAIVESEVDEALKWLEARKNSTLITALGEYMEFIRAREVKRVCREESLSEHEKLERLSTHIVRKITQPLLRKINDARANGDKEALQAYLGLLRDVFGIS